MHALLGGERRGVSSELASQDRSGHGDHTPPLTAGSDAALAAATSGAEDELEPLALQGVSGETAVSSPPPSPMPLDASLAIEGVLDELLDDDALTTLLDAGDSAGCCSDSRDS